MSHGDKDVDNPAEGVWRSRSMLSFAVRALAIGGPVLLATLAARLVVLLLPSDHGWGGDALALLVAVIVSVLLGRFASKLLPLAVLLKMTMIFPDRAPNRVRVARRATSKDELAHRLAHPDPDARETAATLLALVTALGRHDRKTRGHSERVRLYCDLVGEQLGLSASERGRLRWVGLLHDIGKLEVAAEVLNKPGKLSDPEWDAVRTHPHNGAKLAAPLASWLGPWFEGIEHHHERFDGSGYPNGHAGEHISVAGRTVSVVDAFETMTAARSYKSPMSTSAARAELARCAGSHFDPTVVRAFLAISLPRLLWAMGPLTFLINFPFLRWIPSGSGRIADVAAAGANGATTAVGATAVTVAVVASPVAAHQALHDHSQLRLASSDHSVRLRTGSPAPVAPGSAAGGAASIPAMGQHAAPPAAGAAIASAAPGVPAAGSPGSSAPGASATGSPGVDSPGVASPSSSNLPAVTGPGDSSEPTPGEPTPGEPTQTAPAPGATDGTGSTTAPKPVNTPAPKPVPMPKPVKAPKPGKDEPKPAPKPGKDEPKPAPKPGKDDPGKPVKGPAPGKDAPKPKPKLAPEPEPGKDAPKPVKTDLARPAAPDPRPKKTAPEKSGHAGSNSRVGNGG